MSSVYLPLEERELLDRFATENDVKKVELLKALIRRHGKIVATELGKANAAWRGAVSGKEARA